MHNSTRWYFMKYDDQAAKKLQPDFILHFFTFHNFRQAVKQDSRSGYLKNQINMKQISPYLTTFHTSKCAFVCTVNRESGKKWQFSKEVVKRVKCKA